ncbi:MAG: CerR family C-terminal domain-containing protein [Gallionella sp.]
MLITEVQTVSELTRAQLLTAAREVFSKHGFQGATVREICRRAKVNVAAVNYHFGSKEALFSEALNFVQLKKLQTENADSDARPEMRLRQFIYDFMFMLLDENNASEPCQIMARELADPTSARDKIVVEAIKPLCEFLARLVREIVGEKMSEAALLRCVQSLFGQCLFYRHSYPVLRCIYPELRYDHQEIEFIAFHIADFSLAAINQLAQRGDNRAG